MNIKRKKNEDDTLGADQSKKAKTRRTNNSDSLEAKKQKEKERRRLIAETTDQLRNLIPWDSESKKTNQTTVMSSAVEYIRLLQKEIACLKDQLSVSQRSMERTSPPLTSHVTFSTSAEQGVPKVTSTEDTISHSPPLNATYHSTKPHHDIGRQPHHDIGRPASRYYGMDTISEAPVIHNIRGNTSSPITSDASSYFMGPKMPYSPPPNTTLRQSNTSFSHDSSVQRQSSARHHHKDISVYHDVSRRGLDFSTSVATPLDVSVICPNPEISSFRWDNYPNTNLLGWDENDGDFPELLLNPNKRRWPRGNSTIENSQPAKKLKNKDEYGLVEIEDVGSWPLFFT